MLFTFICRSRSLSFLDWVASSLAYSRSFACLLDCLFVRTCKISTKQKWARAIVHAVKPPRLAFWRRLRIIAIDNIPNCSRFLNSFVCVSVCACFCVFSHLKYAQFNGKFLRISNTIWSNRIEKSEPVNVNKSIHITLLNRVFIEGQRKWKPNDSAPKNRQIALNWLRVTMKWQIVWKRRAEISSFEPGRHENGKQMNVRIESENAFSIWKDALTHQSRVYRSTQARNTCCRRRRRPLGNKAMIKWQQI